MLQQTTEIKREKQFSLFYKMFVSKIGRKFLVVTDYILSIIQ